jgi:ketosteroid isomerase-like protein
LCRPAQAVSPWGERTVRRSIREMRPTLVLAAVLLIPPVAAAESATDAIAKLEHEWSAAYLRHDARTVERILADDFVGIDGRGVVSDKIEEIASAKATAAGDFELLAETFTDLRVRIYGDFAIANAISNEKARFKGKDVSPRYRRTTVWVKRDGTWRCVSFHGSLIQEP